MPRRPPQRSAPFLIALLAVALAVGLALGAGPLHGALAGDGDARLLSDAIDRIEHDYYRRIPRGQLVDQGLAGAVRSLHDPFSNYFDPTTFRRFQAVTSGRFSGVGIGVRTTPRGLLVVQVFADSPASHAGIRHGDVIVAVNGTSIAGKPSGFSTSLIQGKPGTPVALTLMSRGRRRIERLTRATVRAPSVLSRLRRFAGARLGYVALASFTSGAHGEVRAAVDRLLRRGARGLILDLRGNGGGLLDEAVLVASIFIPEGTIVSTDGRARPRHVFAATGNAIPARTPVMVLVNRDTASSSEIVTAALQDHHRAKVVGTRTFGKGVFQEIDPLPNGGALDITVGEYFTPSGRNLGGGGVREGRGVKPDVLAKDDPRTRRDEALAIALRTLARELP